MKFSRQVYLSGLLCSPPRDLPDPGIEPVSLGSPEIGRQILYHFATWAHTSSLWVYETKKKHLLIDLRLLWLTIKHVTESDSCTVQFSSVQLLSCVRIFATSWTAAHQASLSFTNSQSLLKFISIELVMPSNHLILCHPLLLLPSIFPTIRVFSNESVLCIKWPKF